MELVLAYPHQLSSYVNSRGKSFGGRELRWRCASPSNQRDKYQDSADTDRKSWLLSQNSSLQYRVVGNGLSLWYRRLLSCLIWSLPPLSPFSFLLLLSSKNISGSLLVWQKEYEFWNEVFVGSNSEVVTFYLHELLSTSFSSSIE